jgi:hypothetical protein
MNHVDINLNTGYKGAQRIAGGNSGFISKKSSGVIDYGTAFAVKYHAKLTSWRRNFLK